MKGVLAACFLMVGIGLVPLGAGTHDEGCQYGQADPATVNAVDLTLLGGGHYYFEERNVPAPFNTNPPIPSSGFLLGDGTWWYQEGNGVPGLQRGWSNLIGDWFPPGCDQEFDPNDPVTWNGVPCLLMDEDSINDENCSHGPDHLIF